MKTLSIYLTLLTTLFMACQKDTDESLVSPKKKQDHCKCPPIYLPKTHSESKYSFTYKDSTGNLAMIDSHNGAKLYFIYGNNNRIEKLQWITDDGELYDKYEITYTGNKPTKLTRTYAGSEVSNYIINWDGDKMKNLIIRRVGEDIALDSIVFSFNSDNSIANYEFYDPNQTESYSGYSFEYKNGDYKYWAKDIKNKEIIFLAMIESTPVIVPASNDILIINNYDYDFGEDWQNRYSRTYHDQQYNEGNYPITFGKTYFVSKIMESWEVESQESVSYTKVKRN